jgi:hypothetical protein
MPFRDERYVRADVRRQTVAASPRFGRSSPVSTELVKHYGLELSIGGFR